MLKKIKFLLLLSISFGASADMKLEEIKQLHNQDNDVLLTVQRINFYFNQFPYKKDMDTKGQSDYWKTAKEFLDDNGGDCEDYAIIKYLYLKDLGIDKSDLRLFFVNDKWSSKDEGHIVLGYYHGDDKTPYILDSISNRVLKGDIREDLKTVYSFNESGYWIDKSFTETKEVKTVKSKTFTDVIAKNKKTGLNYTPEVEKYLTY